MRELILTFHGLGKPPGPVSDSERKVWVPPEWLAAVLDGLPPQGVALAFDDGNVSDVEHALPILTQRGCKAQFFVLAGELGKAGRLTTEDVARLHGAGMRIGSHGLHHRDWRRLSDQALSDELVISRRTLAGIVGEPVAEAACPFGSYDRRVLKALRGSGYSRVCTSDGGATSATSWLAARTTVTRDRPLQDWLDLAAAGPSGGPDPLSLVKRGIKRLR